jgi:hypothetical protein
LSPEYDADTVHVPTGWGFVFDAAGTLNQLAARLHVAWASGGVALFGLRGCDGPPGLQWAFVSCPVEDVAENRTVPVGREPAPPVTVAVNIVGDPLTGFVSYPRIMRVLAELTGSLKTPALPAKLESSPVYVAETVYGESDAKRVAEATLHTALPVPLRGRALFPAIQATLPEPMPLPVMVNVTVPPAFTTGAGVLNGNTAAVKVTACPVVTVAGPVTVVVVGVGPAALALNGTRARADAVATAPTPATMAIFLTRIMVPPERTAVSPRLLAESVRGRRCRGHDRLCRAIPTGRSTTDQLLAALATYRVSRGTALRVLA